MLVGLGGAWRGILVVLGVALALLAFAAPASAAKYPPDHCGPEVDGKVIWYDGQFWECTHFGGYADQVEQGWFWEPRPSVPYSRGDGSATWVGFQVCHGCHWGGWDVWAPRDWVRDTHIKVDYGDFSAADYQTIPQGDGAWQMYFRHDFFPSDYNRSVVTMTIIDGAHAGKSSHTVWADP